MKKFKSAVSGGFTLVELLIVIGLLGAIALIVISAINPIEQSNRARDTRFKADGGQLISAIDRYYTGSNDFPWMVDSALTVDSAFGYITASDTTVGICDATGNCGDGVLLTSQELKSEFKNRDFVKATKPEEMIYIGKDGDANASVYACFVPLSKSFRSKAIADSKVWTIATDGTKATTTSCDTTWATTCYVCIPE